MNMKKPSHDTLEREVVIVNELGLHARSAGKIAALARQAVAAIRIEKGGENVDARSIIDILSLECTRGTKIRIAAASPKDMDILNQLAALVKNGCGE